jgi:predicted regulator of Ras-like GTPase activity (Roadblock/LC7/MglB family)
MARTDELIRVLEQLQSGTPEVSACALFAEDGLIMASAMPRHFDEGRAAGLVSTLMGMAARTALEFQRGALEHVVLEGALGHAVARPASPGTTLLVLADREAAIEVIRQAMAKAVPEIEKIL